MSEGIQSYLRSDSEHEHNEEEQTMLRALVIIILLPFAFMSGLTVLAVIGGTVSEIAQANKARKARNQNLDQCISQLKKKSAENTAEWAKYVDIDYEASCRAKGNRG